MSDQNRKWVSYQVTMQPDLQEAAIDYVLSSGAEAVLETGSGFQFGISEALGTQELQAELERYFQDLDPTVSFTKEDITWENWNAGWRAFFKPTEVGNSFIVLPAWEQSEDPQRIPLRINPGMAFGTGTHETTQLCLQILEECDLTQARVLDLGTGSGILAIAALKLGAEWVDAVDNDEQTAENALENFNLNDLSDDFRLQISDQPELSAAYDVLIVNIIKRHLLPLLPDYFKRVKEGGTVIIGGLLREEAGELEAILGDSTWQIQDRKTKNEWIAFRCTA